MAYSLPAMNAAANYAASFRQVKPVADFSDIRSDVGVKAMQQTVMQDFVAKANMARQALAEVGAQKRDQMAIDFQTERDDKLIAERRRINKLNLLSGLLGESTPGQLPGLGVQRRDPRDMLLGEMNHRSNLASFERGRLGNLDPALGLGGALNTIQKLKEGQPVTKEFINSLKTVAPPEPPKLEGVKFSSSMTLEQVKKAYGLK